MDIFMIVAIVGFVLLLAGVGIIVVLNKKGQLKKGGSSRRM